VEGGVRDHHGRGDRGKLGIEGFGSVSAGRLCRGEGATRVAGARSVPKVPAWTTCSARQGLGDEDPGSLLVWSQGEVGVAVLLLGIATRKRTAVWPCQSSR